MNIKKNRMSFCLDTKKGTTKMLIKRCWFDLKPRFLWAVGFFLCFSVYFIWTYFAAKEITPIYFPGQEHTLIRHVNNYWILLSIFLFELFTVVLALGGILNQKNRSVLQMTLSLPVKRSHWLLAHGGLTALLVFILIFGFTIFNLIVGNIITGEYYPLDTAFLNALFNWLTCLPFIGLSILVNSFFHNGFKSMMTVFLVIFIACNFKLPSYLLNYTFLLPWIKLYPFTWADLVTVIVGTLATSGLVIWKFGKNEY